MSRLFLLVFIILPLSISSQGGTTPAALSMSQQPHTTQLQPTAAVVQENTTSSTNSSTSSTASPTTQNQGASNTAVVGSTRSPSSSTVAIDATTSNTSTTVPTSEIASKTEVTGDLVTDETTTTFKTDETITVPATAPEPAYFEFCPSGLSCDKLAGECLNCSFDTSCVYGREYNTTCVPKPSLDCTGALPVEKSYQCRYCYQTETWQQSCTQANNCQVYACPRQFIVVNCTVHDDVLCLGSRTFHRRKPCNWTSGYKWSTALILSITLGGFGADRFYLGYWQSGLGKLFSFGGAGVWTLIDVLLIAVGYITPSDGSHYI